MHFGSARIIPGSRLRNWGGVFPSSVLRISWELGDDHGDVLVPFDGPASIVAAHAFAPPRDGRSHEIGHLLGLNHSEAADAIMYVYVDHGEIKRYFGDDDIEGIQALYID